MKRSHRYPVWPLALCLALAAVLAASAAASAGWVTINTNDGQVDSQWGTALWTDTDDDPNINNTVEINRAWYVVDGTSITFRIETRAAPALPAAQYQAIAGFDCNGNGYFQDAADRLVSYFWGQDGDNVAVYTGTGVGEGGMGGEAGERVTLAGKGNVEWKVDLDLLPPDCRGSVAPVDVGVSTYDDSTDQVLDQVFLGPLSHPIDYGDLINTVSGLNCYEYPTLVRCNGARHGLGSSLRLGAAVDPDTGDLQNADATADDTSGATPDDEDGVWPTQGKNWTVGANGGSLDVTVSGGDGFLSCWVDWNKDNDIRDSGELVISNRSVSAGTQAQTFTVPSGVTFPNTYNARCRLYATSNASPPSNGPLEFGEVEDYQWTFGAGGVPPVPPAPTPVAVDTLAIARSGANDVLLTWTHSAPNQSYRVLRDATDPYFAPGDADTDLGIVSGAPWEKSDTGVYGAPVHTYYYIVLGRVGSIESGASNRVGLFEFSLTPGD